MSIINTLEEWHKNAILISSPLLIKPVISRTKITFIFNTLKDYFGINFFNIKTSTDTPLNKSIWINQLLANKNHLGSIGALHTIATLIEYAIKIKLIDSIEKLKNNPRNLRTFFYELFIFKKLDENGISNQKKVFIGFQELEGTCNINGNAFLFECRKAFLPKIDELDIMKRLMHVFYLRTKTLNKGMGMICGIRLNRPIINSYRSIFETKISGYFDALNKSTGFATIDYTDEDNNGLFRATNYSNDLIIEAKNIINYDIIFQMIPQGWVNGKLHLRIGMECAFKLEHTTIYKKFESVLKEKKQQHKGLSGMNKILFIDTEIFPGLDMELFQTYSKIDFNMIKSLHQKVYGDSILCLTRRVYSEENPKIITDVFYPDRFRVEGEILKQVMNS